MANTINGINGSNAASIGSGRVANKHVQDAATAATGDAAEGQSSDVHITSTASKLASLGQALSAMPQVDESRVSTLKAAIESGTYSVDSNKIASGLIQSDRALAQLGIKED
jgi:negative regulator of flagellin synthesis FlgM